jgi:hypothetical protein
MAMNAAEELSNAINRALPDAVVSIDAPTHDSGHWWIDVARGQRRATIEWRPKQGFGVGLGPGGYGEGPDLVVSTVDAAVAHVVDHLLSSNTVASAEPTVLVASSDDNWRSAVEQHLRVHRVRADAVGTLSEAYKRSLTQVYLVIVVDLASEPSNAYRELRDWATSVDSLFVTVATSDHVSSFDDSFELVVNKRISTEYVASVVESLVVASATGRLPDANSESA